MLSEYLMQITFFQLLRKRKQVYDFAFFQNVEENLVKVSVLCFR